MAPTAPWTDVRTKVSARAIRTARTPTVLQETRPATRPAGGPATGWEAGRGSACCSVEEVDMVVDALVLDRPAEHHGVVLVGQVVAVRHVVAREVPELAVDDHRLARGQPPEGPTGTVRRVAGNGVLRPLRGGHQLAVPPDRAVLLHVQVEGVHPAAAAVADLPQGVAVLLHDRLRRVPRRVLEAGHRRAGIEL